MVSLFRSLPAFTCFLMLSMHANAAIVSWDGGGGDDSWQNPTNWSGNALPGPTDDVTIEIPNDLMVTTRSNVTIRSVRCANNLTLAGGTFRVTAGSSVVHGAFSTTGNPVLSATGIGTSLTLAGPVDPGTANLEAASGATLSLPTLGTYAKPTGCATVFWEADGAGSVLELSGLTNLSSSACAYVTIQAIKGGGVQLPTLSTVTEGTINFIADGSNSVVNLPALRESTATARAVSFEARNNGEIGIPQFPGSVMSTVTLKTGGVLPLTQLRQLRGFTLSGVSQDFPALTNLGYGNIRIDGGATSTVPLLANHTEKPGCPANNWIVTGAGSLLNFPALTNMSGPDCGWLEIQALAGGTLLLTNVATVTDGTLYFEVGGTNSLIDLRRLQRSAGDGLPVTFTAQNAGTMWMPSLPGGSNVIVSLQTGGILPVAQLGTLRGIEVNAMTVDFPALTNLGNGNIIVSGGGIASIPKIVEQPGNPGCVGRNWLVTGSGSVLTFPVLTNLAGPACAFLNLRAEAGGKMLLDEVSVVAEGTLNFLADGPGSILSLRSLTESQASQRFVSFEARNQGTIAVPQLEGGTTVNIAIKSGGVLDAEQMSLLRGLTVSGTSLALPGISKLFSGNLTVEQGAVLSFPNLFSHDQGNRCNVSRWSVTGSGAVLDLSSLTNLVGGSCGSLIIEALSGGHVLASNLASVSEGRIDFVADGTNSLIDIAALSDTPGTQRLVSFEARNGGEVAMPKMKGGPLINVILRSHGLMPTDQIERLSGITVIDQTADFPALTNFDGGSFTVTNNAVVTAPHLTSYDGATTCAVKIWLVRGPGSALSLPGLSRLTGGFCSTLDMQALNGGLLALGSVTHIPSGAVSVLSSGNGSIVDLHSVANMLNSRPTSRLTATNGGVILLNPDGTLLSGVAVSVDAANSNLPATSLTASNAVLFGRAWHSYWLERRESTDAEWEFYQRVPLTNDFQIIDSIARSGSEFRVWEFLADPPALELAVREDQSVSVVLYGTSGKAVDVEAVDSIQTPAAWDPLYSVTLTNSFRILPTEPPGKPQRYFRSVPRP